MAHVVFIGLGFGGLYTLRHLLDDRPEGITVTAIDRRDRFVFTPLLYEYLAGELEAGVVAPPLHELLPADEVRRIRAEVNAVDLGGRRVHLADGSTLDFDTLVLAPGSVPSFHGVPGAEAHAVPFYSFDDAERLRTTLAVREWAEGSRPACVVGGGVVGIELAFALAELLERLERPVTEPRVVVLEAMDEILRGMSDGLRRMARQKLERKGIRVRTGIRVLEVDERGATFRNGGRTEHFEAAVVAWAAGIQPNPLLDGLPVHRNGRHGVRVEPTLQLPGHRNVFLLGDAISYPGAAAEPLPDTAQAAVQEAEVCAANVRRLLEGDEASEAYSLTRLGDFLRISRREAIADVKGVVVDGAAAALARRAAYLVRLPAWAVRTSAIRQWLGPRGGEERAAA